MKRNSEQFVALQKKAYSAQQEFTFRRMREWEKYLRDDDVPLRPGCSRLMLVAVSFILASYGENGTHIYVADATLAAKYGGDRKTYGKYRREAIRVGYFRKTGEKRGHVEVIDIHIPNEPPGDY